MNTTASFRAAASRFLALLLAATPLAAQEATLVASDGAPLDGFGGAVALDGTTAVVGASQVGANAGQAYVFDGGAGWAQEAILVGLDVADGDQFGASVAVAGDLLVAGAPHPFDPFGPGPGPGAAYLFEDQGGWAQQAKLVASDGQDFDLFGCSVATNGVRVLVGARGDEPSGSGVRSGGTGAVYSFQFVVFNWAQVQKLTASDGAPGDRFGAALAMSGDLAVVGAPGDDDSGSGSGAAYVFRHDGNTWVQEQKLTASDGAADDAFGASVAVSGDVVVVGAWGDDDAGAESGAAYVFRFGGASWSQEQKLVAGDAAAGDAFGYAVAAAGDVAFIGASSADGGPGAGYVFRFDGVWSEDGKHAVGGSELLGAAVATGGEVSLAGAPLTDGPGGLFSGEAYVLDTAPIVDCNDNGVPDDEDIGLGTSDDCNGNGIPDECEPDCNGNGVPDDCDVALGTSDDCNTNGVPDECDIALGTSLDCNGNGVPDECEPDCNGNGVPDDCDVALGTSADCNGNGAPDECDIALGTSDDCNGNGIPDECEPDCNGNGVPDDCDVALGTSPDCNGNGVPDECDLALGTSTDCNRNGVPDECEADCNGNGVPDDCDVALGTSPDCNGNGVPDECDVAFGTSLDCNANGVPDECEPDCNGNGVPDDCDIALGTSPDCNGNGTPDECDVALGTSDDCDGNGVPDECEPDCNGNDVPDACDIALGTSLDCNGNDVPDECDVALGTSADCNGNGIPDECEPDCTGNGVPDDCDIASGTSGDCNGNGVPDECDIASGTSLDLDLDGFPDECQGVWTDLGNALAGTHGEPLLAGEGRLLGDTPITLTLTDVLESTSAGLFVGFGLLEAPFKGGVIVPTPDLLFAGIPTGPAGEIVIGGTWPTGVPSGFVIYQQWWISDPAGPQGLAASNGLSAEAP